MEIASSTTNSKSNQGSKVGLSMGVHRFSSAICWIVAASSNTNSLPEGIRRIKGFKARAKVKGSRKEGASGTLKDKSNDSEVFC